MGERKSFKTKLCVLYQKGRCDRPNCSFAHGSAELRHTYSHNRSIDLRNKLDRRVSPRRMHSPRGDTRGHHTYRGFSPTTSLEKNSGRKSRKKREFEGQSDLSGSLKIPDEAEDQMKRSAYHDSRSIRLKETQPNLDVVDHRKSRFKTLVEEKDAEIHKLTSRIQELEAQLIKEKEESTRTLSKLKKFVKANARFLRAQEELKRSQVHLQKLGDQLRCISNTVGEEENDSSLNIVSDNEGHCTISPHNDALNKSPSKKNLDIEWGVADNSTQGNCNEIKAADHKTADRPLQNGSQNKKRKTTAPLVDKGSGPSLVVPSPSVAANAVVQPVDVEEAENVEIVENISLGNDRKRRKHSVRKLPFPVLPPLPVFRDSYSQNKGEDEHVNIEGSEEEEEVDII